MRYLIKEKTMPNRSVPVLPVPSDLPGITIKSAVAKALNDRVKPEKILLDGIPKKTIFLPPVLLAKVEEAATKNKDLTFDEVFVSLTIAGFKSLQGRNADFTARTEASAPPPFKARSPEQIRFFRNISTSLETERICLAEASTGIGKSRAMVAAAIQESKKRKKVVISAPTLKVLGQLWTEYETLKEEELGKNVSAGFFPGITEFVSPERLAEWLSDSEFQDQAVSEWLEKGGPPLSDSPLIRAMKGASEGTLSFLAEDLRKIAVNLTADDFLLKSEEKDTHPSIENVRMSAIDEDILFCTHAMLARAHQSKWAAFPAPDILIVDEAHQLEQSFAKIHSMALSLSSLRRRLKNAAKETGASSGSAIVKAIKSIDRNFSMLIGKIGGTGERQIRIRADMEFSQEIKEIIEDLEHCLKPKPLSVVRNIKDDRAVIKAALEVMTGKKGTGFLEFSPDLRFPSIVSGRDTVGDILGHLWKSVKGAAICSATLYIPDEFGNNRADYMISLLALPKARTDTPPPVSAPWVTSIPTVHLPSKDLAPLISRPLGKIRNKEGESLWIENIADQCRRIAQNSKGGMLVLTSSFDQIESLEKNMNLPERIVTQKKDEKFQNSEQRFRDLHAKGLRPILIATGGAWTGIDLTDKTLPPDQDRLLTDLVIACAPVGFNRTTSSLYRVEKTGVDSIIKEALLTIKQGLGRLVRHPNAAEKNIWVLDGRIWTEWPGFERFQKSARKMLDRINYKKQEVIPF